jgi:hypothetical protein
MGLLPCRFTAISYVFKPRPITRGSEALAAVLGGQLDPSASGFPSPLHPNANRFCDGLSSHLSGNS